MAVTLIRSILNNPEGKFYFVLYYYSIIARSLLYYKSLSIVPVNV